MILPIIMIVITLTFGTTTYLIIKRSENRKNSTVNIPQKTANEFINVKTIDGQHLITRDGLALCFLKIAPISINLYSNSEKKSLIRALTGELSNIQYPFKFIAVSRPVDISPLISELNDLIINSDELQKEIIKQEIQVMANYALSGEVIERQFYIILWDKEDLKQETLIRANNLVNDFNNCKINCEVLYERDIVKLCNLVNNPAYTHLEDADFEASIPLFQGGIKLNDTK